jgi:hypothetical protein
MKTKSKSRKTAPKKPKRKRIKFRLVSMSKEQREDFQYQIRKYLLAMGAQQINGFRFEHYTKNRNGTITTARYDLLPRAMTIHVLTVKWKRKGKHGNADPYRWRIDTVSFYRDMTIHAKESPVLDSTTNTWKWETKYQKFDAPNVFKK